jgi:hypothetical protein
MSVDRNEKIWAVVNGGGKLHAFVQPGREGRMRAMCRESYQIMDIALKRGLDELYSAPCARCFKLAEAMWDRAEASMQPATEAHDYGYVVPVDERDMDALHAEALTINAISGALDRLEEADRVDALHAEALAMNRAWDKSTAGYAHHYGQRSGRWAQQPATEAHDYGYVAPIVERTDRWVETLDNKRVGFVAGRDPIVIATDQVTTNQDGTLSGPFKTLMALYHAGAALRTDDGELRWS